MSFTNGFLSRFMLTPLKKVLKYSIFGYGFAVSSVYLFKNFVPIDGTFYEKASPIFLPMDGLLLRSPKTLSIFLYCYLETKAFEKYFLFRKDPAMEEKMKTVNIRNANRLLKLLTKNGGIWVKMGQIIASMRGFLPDETCDVLSATFQHVPSVPFAEVQTLFKQEFGKTIAASFSSFDEKPIAAASLAQVHHAMTKDGQEVAVKVQYPKVKYYYMSDFKTSEIIRKVTDLVTNRPRRRDIEESVKEGVKRELDFAAEANNQRRARASFIEGQLDYVYVPYVVDSLCSKRVLTMEFIHGISGSDVEQMRKSGFQMADIATKLFSAIADQIFRSGFVHADPHGGNFFVRWNPIKPTEAQIVLLDHGLYNQLSEEFRKDYAGFYTALVYRDDDGIKSYCDKLGIKNHKLYSQMILMQGMDNVGPVIEDYDNIGKGMTEEQKEFWMNGPSKELRNDVNNILEHFPKEDLLLFRTSFLLRGVSQKLGSPINRFTLFASVARKNMLLMQQEQEQQQSKQFFLVSVADDWLFSARLFIFKYVFWLISFFFKV